MPYFGRRHGSDEAFDKLLAKAMKDGDARKGNRYITIRGECRVHTTFGGQVGISNGTILCTYYGRNVFAIDLPRKCVTDFNMTGFSQCTSSTIHCYVKAIQRVFGHGLPRNLKYDFARWTKTGSAAFDRFCARVPWVRMERYVRWYHWEALDAELLAQYDESCEFLQRSRENQNYRYFDYDWDAAGRWSRKFINPDAERRWLARERHQARKAA